MINNTNNSSISYNNDYIQREYLTKTLNMVSHMDYNTLIELHTQLEKYILKKKQDMYRGGAYSNTNY